MTRGCVNGKAWDISAAVTPRMDLKTDRPTDGWMVVLKLVTERHLVAEKSAYSLANGVRFL